MSAPYNPPPGYEYSPNGPKLPNAPTTPIPANFQSLIDLSSPELATLLSAGSTAGVAVPTAAKQNQSQFNSTSKLISNCGVGGCMLFGLPKEELSDLLKELGLSAELRLAMHSAISEWKKHPHLALEAISMATKAAKSKSGSSRGEATTKKAVQALQPPVRMRKIVRQLLCPCAPHALPHAVLLS
jgi:hypothetical protein